MDGPYNSPPPGTWDIHQSKPPPFVENVLEHVFMTIYTLECIVKIIARGFFVDQMSYVRDPWNLVDLFVVGLGYIMQIIDLVSPYIMKATQEKGLRKI